MKKWIFLLPLLVISLVFSTDSNATPFLFSEALIWQIRESNATNWGQLLMPADPNESIQFFAVPFKWSPGLRVGAGFNSNEKPLAVLFYYTGYQTQGTNQVSTDSGEIHSAFSSNFYANNPQGNGISGPYYHQAGIQWDVTYNTLDGELGQLIHIDPLVSLRPFIGLKAGMINQTIHTHWQEPYEPTTSENPTPTPITLFSAATEVVTNDFKGIGPSFGLDSSWHLYSRSTHVLNLIGKVSGAFLWGHWRFSDVYQNNTPQTIATVSDSLSSSAFMAHTFLGMEWSHVAHNALWNLHCGYEVQAWFNQLQYYSFDMGKTNDTLYLQGAVFGFGIHF